MPNLMTTIGANITPYITAMNTVRDVTAKAGTVTQASLRQAARQLEIAMATATAAGKSTTFYANSLRLVNEQLAILSVNEAKATAAAELLAIAQARVAMGVGTASQQRQVAAEQTAILLGTSKSPAGQAANARRMSEMAAIQTAMLAPVTLGGGHEGGFGTGTGPGGGLTGIVRESMVLIREFFRHNYARMAGSVTLLAQYMGLLGVAIQSSAQDSIKAAAASSKLVNQLGKEAQIAEAVAEASRMKAVALTESAVATDAERVAAIGAAEADAVAATSARGRALAEITKRDALVKSAAIQLAGATMRVGPIGWLIAGLIAVGAAAGLIWYHFHKINEAVENFRRANLKDWIESETIARRKNTEEMQKQVDFFTKLIEQRRNERQEIQHVLELMNKEAEARKELMRLQGASQIQIEQFEEAQLHRQAEFLRNQIETLKGQLQEEARASFEAQNAFGQPKQALLEYEQKREPIYEAVQDWMEKNSRLQTLMDLQRRGQGKMIAEGGPEQHVFTPQGIMGTIPATPIKTVDQVIKEIMAQSVQVKIGSKNQMLTPGLVVAEHNQIDALQKLKTKYQDAIQLHQGNATEIQREIAQSQQRLSDIEAELQIKQKYGRQIAAMEKGGGRGGEVTGRERVGIGTPQVALLGVAQQQLNALHRQNQIGERIVSELKGIPISKTSLDVFRAGTEGVHFGGFQ